MLFAMGPIDRIPRLDPAAVSGIEHDDESGDPAPPLHRVVLPMHTPRALHVLGLVDAPRVALPGPVAGDVPDAVNVSTGRFGVLTRNTPGQVLQTAGAAPCVIVVLHDARNGVAAMAHFHPMQDPVRSVEAMVQAARAAGLDPAQTTAHVAGGRNDAPELPGRVLAALAPHRFRRGQQDLLGMEVRAVQFHLRSGRIESYLETWNDRAPAPNDGPVAELERHPRAWRP